MVQRLGQPELVEPCEELRLYTVELLSSVTEICGGKIGVYIDDMIKILQRTLVDPFHDVRKVRTKKYLQFKLKNVTCPYVMQKILKPIFFNEKNTSFNEACVLCALCIHLG